MKRSESEMASHDKMLELLRKGYVRDRAVRGAQAKIAAGTIDNRIAHEIVTDRILMVMNADREWNPSRRAA